MPSMAKSESIDRLNAECPICGRGFRPVRVGQIYDRVQCAAKARMNRMKAKRRKQIIETHLYMLNEELKRNHLAPINIETFSS